MTRGGAVAARVAHNHEVAGSSPAPATKTSARLLTGFCFGNGADSALRLDSLLAIVAGSVIQSARRSLLRGRAQMCVVPHSLRKNSFNHGIHERVGAINFIKNFSADFLPGKELCVFQDPQVL